MTRDFHPGMGQAVAERSYLRRVPEENNRWETWGEVAHRVARGNSLLVPDNRSRYNSEAEFETMRKHMEKGVLVMSGRHLQHGDENQPTKNMELFTNCATSATSFTTFLLLMNGSGVGRCYDDDMMLVNWDHAPVLKCVLDENHPDFNWSAHESVRDAKHKYGSGKDVLWHQVADTREGWAKALEIWENAAFEKIHKDKMLILDFSLVRCKGTPIRGLQNRPASGPVPLMNAFQKASTLKGANIAPWLQNMYVDHYLAECVLVGGARRSSRIATKYWKDETIYDFIQVKRPIEYMGLKPEQIVEHREVHGPSNTFLWSANNSVAVDQEFWDLVNMKRKDLRYNSDLARHARRVFRMVSKCSYADGTGEPGFLNVHRLTQKDDGWDRLKGGEYVGSKKYQVEDDTQILLSKLVRKAKKKAFYHICNPCAEITLTILGGFCVIGSIAPFFADTIEEVEDAVRACVRALIRVNLMDSIYHVEVQRSNRIGVGMLGVHEFAWKFFGHSFHDLIDEEKSRDFWDTIDSLNAAAVDEAKIYSEQIGVVTPHTVTMIAPNGTTSKLFGLTEGWHLPAMDFYLRNCQFSSDDPLVYEYQNKGYPTRKLKTYNNVTIVGFPTAPVISKLIPKEKLVLASEATPEQQYKWLKLGEKYWIDGTRNGNEKYGNQISYTLKYDPERVSLHDFTEMMKKHQSESKCCSVMPQTDMKHVSYEYLPEEIINRDKYDYLVSNIEKMKEDVDLVHVDCASGGCPITFNKE